MEAVGRSTEGHEVGSQAPRAQVPLPLGSCIHSWSSAPAPSPSQSPLSSSACTSVRPPGWVPLGSRSCAWLAAGHGIKRLPHVLGRVAFLRGLPVPPQAIQPLAGHEAGWLDLNLEKDLEGLNELVWAKPSEPGLAHSTAQELLSGVGFGPLLGLLLTGPSACTPQERLVPRGLCEAPGGGAHGHHEPDEPYE